MAVDKTDTHIKKMTLSLIKRLTIGSCLLLLSLPSSADTNTDIYAMDIEQLMNVEVISVSKKSQSLLKTAAAIHVISQEDIRRSGATTLPEVLRGTPGLQVAQIDTNKWAVSIRGFNGRFANNLLVMIDGRTVYNPIFAGVLWNMQDILLDDIDRIEIIRGPGGTMWGANAVNGVINILTKKASETQGTQISFIGGSQERNISARYGGKISDDTSFRIYAKGKHFESFNNVSQLPANDEWRNFTTGFRVDSDLDAKNQLMMQGSYLVGSANQFTRTPSLMPLGNNFAADTEHHKTGNALFRWDRQQSADSKWRVQAYYDYINLNSVGAEYQVHTIDLEIQNQLKIAKSHELIWGVGYRGILDELESTSLTIFNPKRRYTRTFNAFIQDEISLAESVRLTLGSKLEHNSYTGFEFQPNARMLWEVNDRNSIWGAISRSVQVPSRAFNDVRINFLTAPGNNAQGLPSLFSRLGNNNVGSKKVYAFEIGYRSQLTETFTLDTTMFYNYYDDLTSNEISVGLEAQPAPPHILIAGNIDNKMTANTYGAEILTKWQVASFWQLTSSYTWFKLNAQLKNSSTANPNSIFQTENSDPRHQFSIRSNVQLPYKLEFNSMFHYTDRLMAHDINNQARLDLRLAWVPTDKLELSIVGQNITNKQHAEFTTPFNVVQNTAIPRSVYARIIRRF